MPKEHVLPIQIYYEDTDFSGVVYHANYLKFFERAREHSLGVDFLLACLKEDTLFAVYRADLTYQEPARFGEQLEVRSSVEKKSEYQLEFKQNLWRPQGSKPMVRGIITLVCLSGKGELKPIPSQVISHLQRLGYPA
jgi:acyl-CoA thioester hydrolase